MKKIIYGFVLVFVIVTAITSNTIFNIPVKIISFGLIIAGISALLLSKKIYITIYELRQLIVLFFILSFWGIIGLYNGYYETVFQQGIKIVSVFGTWLAFYVLINNKLISSKKQYKLIEICLIVSICAKMMFESLYLFGVMTPNDVEELIKTMLSLKVMTMDISDGLFIRLGTITDVLPLSIFFAVYPFMSKRGKLLVTMGIIFLVVINYSRAYMAQVAVFFLILCMPKQFRLLKLKSFVYGMAVMLISATVVMIGWQDISNIMSGRFMGDNAEASDYVRLIQLDYLLKGINEAPVLGHGLGSYVPEYTRGDELPFLYEMEWFALAYQFGIAGCLCLLLLFLMIIKKIRVGDLDARYKCLVALNIVFYFARPFANPMLLASNSIMILVFMYMFAEIYRNEKIGG